MIEISAEKDGVKQVYGFVMPGMFGVIATGGQVGGRLLVLGCDEHDLGGIAGSTDFDTYQELKASGADMNDFLGRTTMNNTIEMGGQLNIEFKTATEIADTLVVRHIPGHFN